MKHKILLLTIITIFTTSNIFAQITWDNATAFEMNGINGVQITSSSSIIYFKDSNNDIYTILGGETTLKYSDLDGGIENVGGVINVFGGVSKIKNLSNLEVILEDANGIDNGCVNKGDTSVYSNSLGIWLAIGTADPVELIGVDASVVGYVIMNGHIFVYETFSATQTKLWDFDVNDLGNPTSEIIGERVFSITFLDGFQVKFAKINDEWHTYFYDTSNGWQQIDDNIFNGNYYYDYALTYYGDNDDICLTGLDNSTGNLLQIYTAGLPSTENDILTFSFSEQTGNATINSTNHTVDIEVANGTNLTNLVATFTLSDMATAFIGTTEQIGGTSENDFSNSVTYTIEAENGETQEWTITVTEATVGINAISKNEFSIYPNPTNGKINIETNQQIEKITILDISGKIIIETTNKEIDLSKQKTGTYFVKIETENGIFTEKIIIE